MSKQESKDERGRPATRNQPFFEEIEAKPFWANLKEHHITAQRCSGCGRFRFPPQALCPACLAGESEWVQLSGKGKVYSHVTYNRAWHPYYRDKVPYNVSLIETDEGVRMVSNVVGCRPEEVTIGMPVEVVYEDMGDYVLPKFRPASS
jgi:hypothetical protein